jgi:hypothetical protein
MAGFLDLLKTIGPYIQGGGEIAGAIGTNRAAGRAAEGTANQAQSRAAVDRYSAEQLAKLGGARLLEDATKDRADRFLTDAQTRARQVGLGDLLANVQDVNIGGLPSYIPHIGISGGLRPSALGPNARAGGQNLSRMALEAQLSGSDIPNLPDVSGIGTPPPELAALPQSGKLDSILNMLGYAGLGAGAFEEATKDRSDEESGQLANRRMPLTQGGMTVPSASAGGIPGTTAPLANRMTTIELLNRAAAAQRGGTGYGG